MAAKGTIAQLASAKTAEDVENLLETLTPTALASLTDIDAAALTGKKFLQMLTACYCDADYS
jgi:hypothetical protein